MSRLSALLVAVVAAGPLHGEEPRVDALGDPLPPGAVARFGSGRFRSPGHGAHLAPDGKHLLRGLDQWSCSVIETATGKEVRRLPFNGPRDFSPSGELLAGVKPDGTVLIWEVASGQERQRFGVANEDDCWSMIRFSADGKAVAIGREIPHDKPALIRVFDVASGKRLAELRLPHTYRLGMAFADANMLASWGEAPFAEDGQELGQTVILWDLATGREARRLRLDEEGRSVVAAAVAPDGKSVAVLSNSGMIRAFDPTTGKVLYSFQGRRDVRRDFDFSPDGRLLAAAAKNGAVLLWDVVAKRPIETAGRPPGGFASLAFRPEGALVAALDWSGVVLWEVPSGKVLTPRIGHAYPVGAVTFASDGQDILSAGSDGTVLTWDVLKGRVVRRVETDLSPEEIDRGALGRDVPIAFSADGRLLLSRLTLPAGLPRGLALSRARLRAQPSGVEVFATAEGLGQAALSSNGGVVAETVRGREPNTVPTVRLWETTNGKGLPSPQRLEGRPVGLALSPDGKLLAVVEAVGETADRMGQIATLRLWETASGREARSLGELGWYPAPHSRALAFSPDAGVLVAGATLYDLLRGQSYLTLTGEPHGPAAFSPDGRLLAMPDKVIDGVSIWEVATGRKRLELPARGATCLAFSPDGKLLATGGADTTILLWDVTGQKLGGVAKPALADLPKLWDRLADDAPDAEQVLRALQTVPVEAVALVRRHVRPADRGPDAQAVARLLADLDSEDFDKREAAAKALEEAGPPVVPALRKALEGKPGLELKRRLDLLLEKLDPPGTPRDLLRPLRAVELLERLGTAVARDALTALAAGASGARLTSAAQAALDRWPKP
jgi:WD40 repeat protein